MAKALDSIVYVATYAVPGHLPDTPQDIVCFSTKAKARAYAAQKQRENKGPARAGYTVSIATLPLAEATAEGCRIL